MNNLKKLKELQVVMRTSDTWSGVQKELQLKSIDPSAIIVVAVFQEDAAKEYWLIVTYNRQVYEFYYDWFNAGSSELGAIVEWYDFSDNHDGVYLKEELADVFERFEELSTQSGKMSILETANSFSLSAEDVHAAETIREQEITSSGKSTTIHGELLRCVDFLRYKVNDINHANNDGNMEAIDFLRDYLVDPRTEPDATSEILNELQLNDDTSVGEGAFDTLTLAVLDWWRNHPGPNLLS